MTTSKVYRPGFATASDARVLQTRKALRAALLQLLDVKPLEEITIREIAETAGVNYTTFFRHHTGKEDLLDEIASAEIRSLFDLTLPALVATDMHGGARALCTYVAEHRALWRRLLTGGAAARLREAFIELTREFAAEHGSDHDWLPPEVGVILGASGTIELLTWWLQQESPISVQQLATIHERLIVQPLMTPGRTPSKTHQTNRARRRSRKNQALK
jgi:AcrR family transcriptional regulator